MQSLGHKRVSAQKVGLASEGARKYIFPSPHVSTLLVPKGPTVDWVLLPGEGVTGAMAGAD